MARTLDQPGSQPDAHIEDLAQLGELVRHRRLDLTLRIDDAAHACGVAANVLSRLENGKPVGADRLLRVLSGLGLAMLVTSKETARRYESTPPLMTEGTTGSGKPSHEQQTAPEDDAPRHEGDDAP
jgi:transcriptional regulator with XRE-family HTH domain